MENKLIYKKMSLIMKDIGPVAKSGTNEVQKYKFRGVDQFINSLHPALVKHGVFMVPECTSETHELKDVVRSNGKSGIDKHVSIMMKYHFYAEDGSVVTVGPLPAEGLDSGDKATNKALSAALKYALIQTFSIPTEDMAEADLESPVISNLKSISSEPSLAVSSQPVKTAMGDSSVISPSQSRRPLSFKPADSSTGFE